MVQSLRVDMAKDSRAGGRRTDTPAVVAFMHLKESDSHTAVSPKSEKKLSCTVKSKARGERERSISFVFFLLPQLRLTCAAYCLFSVCIPKVKNIFLPVTGQANSSNLYKKGNITFCGLSFLPKRREIFP